MKALILSYDDFEDSELLCPRYRLQEAGVEVTVAALKKRSIRGKHGYLVNTQLSFKDVDPGDFDVLVLPGGRAPERVRLEKAAIDIARHFFDHDKPVAAICHGQQLLMSAGLLKGRKATAWHGIMDDLIACGAEYIDQEVVVDGNLITSRRPKDLPAFNREIIKKIESIR